MTTRTGNRRRLLVAVTLLCAVAVATAGVLLFRHYQREWQTTYLHVQEGWRASQVYEAADRALSVPEGTTEKAAKRAGRKGKLELPAAAKGNPEGYLYPSTYVVRPETSPTSLVKSMVKKARTRHTTAGVPDYDTLVVASVIQAEANTPQDMAKVSRVIQNRLKRDMPLQMDSTINYALNRSTLNTSHADTRLDSPYNTYRHKGLPPSPIGNPGPDAIKAAQRPTPGDWLYFVTVKPGDTRFTDDYEQHKKWVEEFNQEQGNGT
ncbi:endolytic transglycosylase MltG [Streptomyces spirodelae]|uniref:Endolytic murein transglycosylase n=1 Tax=Streptomyces spirodelae TaxID=2812904 RepID=A0ABS3WXS2_9ACTN|nr:endolytic transglycosylase MltG [Streptomyces spirodelae]MBO8187891.1 endolytic transglycosylase MltG [Streptomyces spirodelae]